ncbi:SAM-dependent methyltransferase, tRNA(uracil-5)-methyltransferase [Frankia sp. EI5c]|uniref:class I SAM-dependent RNA methyltransferase n=1 Tax=Frankia sp. EI5c TaxID=683316 RepID=UPI0007C39FE0|nr:TRAM domain-containing protein [Frankia sp. EI5c]OAA28741.1 SAM-dependent methyltransferase, tRNA(uracil-5)-methyltransferase [Frankia sp. EI5c]
MSSGGSGAGSGGGASGGGGGGAARRAAPARRTGGPGQDSRAERADRSARRRATGAVSSIGTGRAQPGPTGRARATGGAGRADRTAPAAPAPPGELVELEVGPVAHHGLCVARADGRVVFVRHALPGERVRARITDVSHDRYWRADAIEILVASPDRVEPPCPHAGPGRCGGCDWQHASLEAQRQLKARVVEESLRRIAGLELAVEVEAVTTEAPDGLGWRTRMRFSRLPDGGVGLRAHRSHQVVPTPDCRIADPLLAAVIADPAFLLDVAPPERTGQAVELLAMPPSAQVPAVDQGGAVAYSTRSGNWRAFPVRSGDGPRSPGADEGAEVTEVVETVEGRSFRLEPGVFWQIHPAAAATLVAAVRAAVAARPGDTALDLYCGAGLFAAFLAVAVGPAGKVIALESEEAAVRSAARSLADLPWVSLRALRVTPATVRGLIGTGSPSGGGVDVVVLDPPRTGAGREVMAELLAHRPRRVVYVACDPAALARDLAAAAAEGYRLTALRAFDIFPMTAHVECVATLEPAPAEPPGQTGA